METKPLEIQGYSHRALAKSPSDRWKGLERRVRQQPAFHIFMAVAIGYILPSTSIPFRSLLALALVIKLGFVLAIPTLFLFCAFQGGRRS